MDRQDKNRLIWITCYIVLLLVLFLTQGCTPLYVIEITKKNENTMYMEGVVLNSTDSIIVTFNSSTTDWLFIDSSFVGDTVVISQEDYTPIKISDKKIFKILE